MYYQAPKEDPPTRRNLRSRQMAKDGFIPDLLPVHCAVSKVTAAG
jgi:hypothetical protein